METKRKQLTMALFFLAVVLLVVPQLSLFSLLSPNQYNANSDKSFLTNVNFGLLGENINSYSTDGSWISVDWNHDGVLEGYGYGSPVSTTSDLCAYKEQITLTPIGLRVVKYMSNEQGNTVAICSDDGHNSVKYSNSIINNAIINLSEGICVNCEVPQNSTEVIQDTNIVNESAEVIINNSDIQEDEATTNGDKFWEQYIWYILGGIVLLILVIILIK